MPHAGVEHQRRRPVESRKSSRQLGSSHSRRSAASAPLRASIACSMISVSAASTSGTRRRTYPGSIGSGTTMCRGAFAARAKAALTVSKADGCGVLPSTRAAPSSRSAARVCRTAARSTAVGSASGTRACRSSQLRSASRSGSRSRGARLGQFERVATRSSHLAPVSVRESVRAATPAVESIPAR